MEDGCPRQRKVVGPAGIELVTYHWSPTSGERSTPPSDASTSASPPSSEKNRPRLVLSVHGLRSHARREVLSRAGKTAEQLYAEHSGGVPVPVTAHLSWAGLQRLEINEEAFQKKWCSRVKIFDFSAEQSEGGKLCGGLPEDPACECSVCNGSYKPRPVSFHGSWIERLTDRGYHVISFDLQGHGNSGAWRDRKLLVNSFDDHARDLLLIMRLALERPPATGGANFFGFERPPSGASLMGTSMGACIVGRALELLAIDADPIVNTKVFDRECGATSIFSSHDMLSRIQSAILLGPMLGLPMAREQAGLYNRFLVGLVKAVSAAAPSMPVSGLQDNPIFPWANLDGEVDPLVATQTLPARLVAELFRGIEMLHRDASQLREVMISAASRPRLLVVHSLNDTLCDPQGSVKFATTMNANAEGSSGLAELWLLEDLWHALCNEPGGAALGAKVVDWLEARVAKVEGKKRVLRSCSSRSSGSLAHT